ncbi:hypothetical protein [Chitinibacter sp. GC72]|uniref:hypothetical protein n=1 Tax=Chitinibacter sp. GC72 TaxID=1526917 RepID=UPI0012FCA160|nr:hypothetical protein [Chitinibacter sp. GC72]
MSAALQTLACLVRWLDNPNAPILIGASTRPEEHSARETLLGWRWLKPGQRLVTLNCPECGLGAPVHPEQDKLYCTDCGDIDIPSDELRAYHLDVGKIMTALQLGLNAGAQPAELIPQHLWLVGKVARKNKQIQVWLACGLGKSGVAQQIDEMLTQRQFHSQDILLTSSGPERWQNTPLAQRQPKLLLDSVHLGRANFHFDNGRLAMRPVLANETLPDNLSTLDYVTDGYAVVDGERHKLTPQQKKMLLALMQHPDHEMTKGQLQQAVGSTAAIFKPVDVFKKTNRAVYDRFIQYHDADEVYLLVNFS